MPKETFFNLPEEKKERVIEAAMEEFAQRSYYKARITAIADNAGIARGSFYQYFSGKKDLFKYIIELAVNKKLTYINQDMMAKNEEYSFFQLLHESFRSGVRFAKENPLLAAIGNKLINNKELQREIWGEHKDTSSDFFKKLLELGLEKGEVDPEQDIELIARLLTALFYSLSDIIYKDGKLDPHKFDKEMETIEKMIYFIENGIRKKEDN
ncbi:MAG: TetR/AcrR family transcriptional regulator [Halanaerobiaceae bacterium]